MTIFTALAGFTLAAGLLVVTPGLDMALVLRTLAVVGTPEECAAEIKRRFGDVADRVCAYFPGTQHPTSTIRALAEALRS